MLSQRPAMKPSQSPVRPSVRRRFCISTAGQRRRRRLGLASRTHSTLVIEARRISPSDVEVTESVRRRCRLAQLQYDHRGISGIHRTSLNSFSGFCRSLVYTSFCCRFILTFGSAVSSVFAFIHATRPLLAARVSL